MKLAYESERGGIRIYENEDGSVVQEVRAKRALYRSAVGHREAAIDPVAVRALGEKVLDHIIREDYEGEPFGEVELKSLSEHLRGDGDAIQFDVTRRDSGNAMVSGIVLIDYYRQYWPATPEEEETEQ